MKKLTTLLFSLLIGFTASSQDIHFSNFNLMPAFINPAWNHSVEDDLHFATLYRNQGFSYLPNPFESFGVYAQGSFKLMKKSPHRFSVQSMFLSDRAGVAQLSTNGGNLGVAYHLFLDRYGNHQLSLGAQGTFEQMRLGNPEALVFENDLIGNGSGESLENLNQNSFSWKAGISQSSQLTPSLYVSFGAAMGLKNYLSVLTTEPQKQWKYSLHASLEQYLGESFSISPRFYYQQLGEHHNQIIQGILSYKFNSFDHIKLLLGGGVRLEDAAMILIGFEYNDWKAGLSYDINTSDLAQVSKYASALELGVMYTLNFRKKDKIKIKKLKVERKKKEKEVKVEEEPVISIVLSVVEEENDPLPDASIQFIHEDFQDTLSQVMQHTNLFTRSLTKDRRYKIILSKEGYFPDTSYASTYLIRQDSVLEREVRLAKVPYVAPVKVVKGTPVTLNEIYYDLDDYRILPESVPRLQTIYRAMEKYPELKIELSSHTDSRGDDAYNLELSKKRAKSVTDWLTTKGIDPERFVSKGMGESQLVNHCKNGVPCSEEEHRKNRRTEFRILEGPEEIYLE